MRGAHVETAPSKPQKYCKTSHAPLLCRLEFSTLGDRLATAALLPRCEVGDWVMVLDAGAYTLSMASRYNSRSSPAVYGFSGGPSSGAASSGDAGVWAVKLRKLRGRETLQQVLDYWNIE
jgi:hypothetical protein